MRYRIWQTAVMALLIGAQGGLWTAEAQASGLFDWLSRCGSSADPQVMYYPVTTAYQTSACDCGEPAVSCQSPDPMCCPPTAIYQPRPSFWPRWGACWASPATQPMMSMAPPQTYYRTSWKKIPVTSYRPVMSTDPVTGCPVTVMKPCTTYTWQAGRERCGFFDRLFGRCDPPATQVQCCVPTTCCCADRVCDGRRKQRLLWSHGAFDNADNGCACAHAGSLLCAGSTFRADRATGQCTAGTYVGPARHAASDWERSSGTAASRRG